MQCRVVDGHARLGYTKRVKPYSHSYVRSLSEYGCRLPGDGGTMEALTPLVTISWRIMGCIFPGKVKISLDTNHRDTNQRGSPGERIMRANSLSSHITRQFGRIHAEDDQHPRSYPTHPQGLELPKKQWNESMRDWSSQMAFQLSRQNFLSSNCLVLHIELEWQHCVPEPESNKLS